MRPDILTVSGQYLNLVRPDPDCITIEAIAHALASICRFGGHTRHFYSVAEHSVRVAASDYVPSWLKFDALMHDAAEAFVGDMCSPLKRLIPGFGALERRIMCAIEQRFGCYETDHPLVKQADRVLMVTERRDLMPAADYTGWELEGVSPLDGIIRPMTPRGAKEAFLLAFTRYAPLDHTAPSEGVPA